MSLETKMRMAGLPIDELPGPPVFPVPGTPRERAERGHRMVRAGYLGEKAGPPSTAPEDMRLLFDTLAGGLDGKAAAAPESRPPAIVPKKVSMSAGSCDGGPSFSPR